MRFKEINEDIDDGFYNPKNDTILKAHISDTTKPKLTLKTLNQLKKLRIAKNAEKEKKSKMLVAVYGKKDDENNSGF